MTGVFLLCVVALSASTARGEFATRKIRYVSGYDTITLLTKTFPGHGQSRNTAITLACDSVQSQNRDVLGGSSPISGQPLMEKPNPGFLRWLNQCLTQYAKFEFSPDGAYRAGFAKTYLPIQLQSENLVELMKRKWTSLPADVRGEIVDRLARKMVGPPVVYAAYSPGQDWTTFIASLEKSAAPLLPTDASIATAFANFSQTIFLRDEFLRY